MTTPAPPVANPDLLIALINTYGRVSSIPPDKLAQAGYDQATANNYVTNTSSAQQGMIQQILGSYGGLGFIGNMLGAAQPSLATGALPGLTASFAGMPGGVTGAAIQDPMGFSTPAGKPIAETLGAALTPQGAAAFTPSQPIVPPGGPQGYSHTAQDPYYGTNQAADVINGLVGGISGKLFSPGTVQNAGVAESAPGQFLKQPDYPVANATGAFGNTGVQSAGGVEGSVGAGTGGMGAGGSAYQNPYSPVALPTAPAPYQYKANDFTNQANQMAASAYAPGYSALDLENQQNQKNFDYASQMVGGLYNQMGVDIGNNTQAMNKNYDMATQLANQNAASTANTIGNTYSSSQNQVADLLKSLGADPGTSTALLGNAGGEQAYQQNTANVAGQAQDNALAAQKVAAQQYQIGEQQANASEGAVQQQDLLQQLSGQNNAEQQQRLNLASSQAQQALGLGTTLSAQDMALQQAQAGEQQNAFQNQLGLANAGNQNYQWGVGIGQTADQNAIGNQLAMRQLLDTEGQNTFSNQMAIQQAAAAAQAAQYAAQYKAWQDSIANKQFGITSGIQQQNADTAQIAQQLAGQRDLNTATYQTGLLSEAQQKEAAAEAAANLKNSQFGGPMGVLINDTAKYTGGDTNLAQKYAQLAADTASKNVYNDPREFAKAVATAALSNNLDPAIAQNAAYEYYDSPMALPGPSGGWAGANSGKK